MRTRSRSIAAGVAGTALLAASIVGISSASAEEIVIDNVAVTGSLTVAGKDAALPTGAAVSGNYDDESGDLALQFTVPEAELVAVVDGIGDVPVRYQLTNPGGINGNVDDDGAVTASGTFQLDLIKATIAGAEAPLDPCGFGPIEMDFTGTLEDSVLTLTDGSFTIPGTEDDCGGVATLINPQVASDGNTANLVADLDVQAEEPTTTTTTEPAEEPTTTTTTPPANGGGTGPATGAQPVSGTANYTG